MSRQADSLVVDGQPFRFTGINVYNANSSGQCGPNLSSSAALDDALSAMGPGVTVIRAWFFQSLATTGGQRDWSTFDHTLAVAAAHGVRVVATLANQWADCEPASGYKDETWYQGGYTQPDPGGTVSYLDWVGEVAARYANDPTVLAWQLMNEAEVKPSNSGGCSTNAEALLEAFAGDVGGAVKTADPNHLVSLGTIGSGQCGTSADEYRQVHAIPEIDLCEFHDYDPTASIPGDEWNGLQVRIDQCATLGKPLFIGELGIQVEDAGGLDERATILAQKIEAELAAGIDGVLPWAWFGPGGPATTGYDIGPGDPVLDVLRHALDPVDVATTELISVSDAGGPGNSYSQLDTIASNISDDGNLVAFASYATDLIPGGTGPPSIFVRDRAQGTTELVSVAWDGGAANDRSYQPTISGNGRYVAFLSYASNLVDPATGVVDGNGTGDVYLRDLLLDETFLISVATDDTQGNGPSERPAMSDDGRYVAFDSTASTLVPPGQDTNGTSDIFIRDRDQSTTSLVSIRSDGVQGNGPSLFPTLSSDGRTLAFATNAVNFLSGSSEADVVRDLSIASGWTLEQAPGSDGEGALSADGRYVVYTSGSQLVPEDSNAAVDVYRYDRQSSSIALVSRGVSGQATGAQGGVSVAIDDDGDSIVFVSGSDQLLAPGQDTNQAPDIFVWRAGGAILRASVASDGAQADAGGSEVDIDAGGTLVVFSSYATNLVPPLIDTASFPDVFVRVLSSGPAISVPGPPTSLSAIPGDGRVTVSWAAPTNDGGAPIDGYVVTPISNGVPGPPIPVASTQTVVSGLTNGTPYTFSVVAHNSVGDSTAAGVGPVTPFGRPGKVGGISVIYGDGTVTLSWPAATSNGRAIDGYLVTGTTAEAPVVTRSVDGTTLQTTFSTLPHCLPYSFTVQATNAAGPGPMSDALAGVVAAQARTVAVEDTRYVPPSITGVELCMRVTYTFAASASNRKPHSVTDFKQLGPNNTSRFLYNSGAVAPGGSPFTYLFQGAAFFTYRSTATGASGTFTGGVGLPVTTSPTTGVTTTPIDVRWGQRPASWLVFDVQFSFRKAGKTTWSTWTTWLKDQTGTHASFTPSVVAPKNGPGTYKFRATLRNPTTKRTSDPSSEQTVWYVTVT